MSRTQRKFGAFGAGFHGAGRERQPRGTHHRPGALLTTLLIMSRVVIPFCEEIEAPRDETAAPRSHGWERCPWHAQRF